MHGEKHGSGTVVPASVEALPGWDGDTPWGQPDRRIYILRLHGAAERFLREASRAAGLEPDVWVGRVLEHALAVEYLMALGPVKTQPRLVASHRLEVAHG